MIINPRPLMKLSGILIQMLDEIEHSIFIRENGKLYARYDRIEFKEMDGEATITFYWRTTPVHAVPLGRHFLDNEAVVVTGIDGRMEVLVNGATIDRT